VVNSYRLLGQSIVPIFRGPESSGKFLPMFWDSLSYPFSVDQRVVVNSYRFWDTLSFPSSIGCPKTSVINYHYPLRNNAEECGSLHVSSFQIRVGNAESVVPGTK